MGINNSNLIMTQKVKRNVKILGERISKRFNNKPKTGEKTGGKRSLKAIQGCRTSKTTRKPVTQVEAMSHTNKGRVREREKLCFVFNGLIETV